MNPSIFIVAAFLLIASLAPSPAAAAETLAQPVRRDAPAYPAKCASQQGAAVTPQEVKVAYDVARDGRTEFVRVIETTDDCFNEAAVAAVQDWEFEPRMIDGAPRPQTGLTTTLAFVLEGEGRNEKEARPLHREPPTYPKRCMNRAEEVEFVTIRFDVSARGATENIVVIDSTNDCFESAAVSSIEQWRYTPATAGGRAVARTGVEKTITFQTE